MKNKIKTIDMTELMINRANKLNRNDGIVKSGCGYHKDKTKYNRKTKHKKTLQSNL